MSGTEMQRAKESAAEIMRKKQAAGKTLLYLLHSPPQSEGFVADVRVSLNSRSQEGRSAGQIVGRLGQTLPVLLVGTQRPSTRSPSNLIAYDRSDNITRWMDRWRRRTARTAQHDHDLYNDYADYFRIAKAKRCTDLGCLRQEIP